MSGINIRRGSVSDAGVLATFGAKSFTAAFAVANHPEDIRIYVDKGSIQQAVELALVLHGQWVALTKAGNGIQQSLPGFALGVLPVPLQNRNQRVHGFLVHANTTVLNSQLVHQVVIFWICRQLLLKGFNFR